MPALGQTFSARRSSCKTACQVRWAPDNHVPASAIHSRLTVRCERQRHMAEKPSNRLFAKAGEWLVEKVQRRFLQPHPAIRKDGATLVIVSRGHPGIGGSRLAEFYPTVQA